MVDSIFGSRPVFATGYRSPESGQDEKFIYFQATDNNWHLVFTVPVGKTFFLSSIIMSTIGNGLKSIAIGEAASEVTVFASYMPTDTNMINILNVPMAFPSGTKISVLGFNLATDFNLTGWVE